MLEKQVALLIDSAKPETTIIVSKIYMNGKVTNLEIKEGKIFVYVDNQGFSRGYPFFTEFNTEVDSDDENHYLRVK